LKVIKAIIIISEIITTKTGKGKTGRETDREMKEELDNRP